MALAIVRRFLSGSTDGLPITISGTASGGTPIHTGSTSTAVEQQIFLFANNSSTGAVSVTLEWGTANQIIDDVPARAGLYPLLTGNSLWGRSAAGTVLTLFASSSQVIDIYGYLNQITES